MRLLYLLLVIACICSCERSASYRPSEKQNLANEIRKKAATKISKELGLIPCGTAGQMLDQIKMLGLSFDYREPIDVETGRELLIAAVQELAAEINGDPRIRPYLDKYPFEPKNIEIEICLHNRKGSNFGPEQLCIVSAIEGVLKYKIHDSNNRLTTIYQETYEEALQKIKDSTKNNTEIKPKAEPGYS